MYVTTRSSSARVLRSSSAPAVSALWVEAKANRSSAWWAISRPVAVSIA